VKNFSESISREENVVLSFVPAAWTPVLMNEGTGVAQRLYAITTTGRTQDVARAGIGGNMYVLNAYRGKIAQIYFDLRSSL
jgi:hypothetical protein